ncbi:ssDNA endonuclease and repair protein rad10 [Rhizophlyctis rosea]|nr:ssDNA endonuclease and repair protein rad10 [Rhizophlyctis rosea]
MAEGPPPPRKPLFRIPSQAEVESRQKDVQQRAATVSFKPSAATAPTPASHLPAQQPPQSTSSASTQRPSTSASAVVPPQPRSDSATARPTTTQNTAALASAPTTSSNTLSQQFAFVKETPHYVQGRELAAKHSVREGSAGPSAASGSGTGASGSNVPFGGRATNPSLQRSRSSNSVVVNKCQEGNTVLSHIRNVPWEYGDIIPDYQVGQTSCALFLSLKYHRIHPEYIHTRIKQLGHNYLIRVLLCLVDITDHQQSLRDLTRVCLYNNLTLVLSWSPEEAGRYLETFKAYEHKPPDLIKERIEGDYLSKLTDSLTQIKSVNKTDVVTLASTFGSLQNIIHATPDDLSTCPGFGQQKIRRLYEAFNQPFVLNKKQRRS